MLEAIQNLDEAIVLFTAQHLRFSLLNTIMVLFSVLGNAGAIWLIIGIVLMIFKRHRRFGFIMLLCLGLCTVVNTIVLKNIIARPRPFVELEGLVLLVKPLSGYSFPSGHASSSFAAAVSLYKSYGGRGALSFIPAAIIALSRVYVGVHYLSDVVTGAVVGLLCALLVHAWYNKNIWFSLFKQSP